VATVINSFARSASVRPVEPSVLVEESLPVEDALPVEDVLPPVVVVLVEELLQLTRDRLIQNATASATILFMDFIQIVSPFQILLSFYIKTGDKQAEKLPVPYLVCL
jgi:hypothetical protein